MDNLFNLPVQDMAGLKFECSCGRTHQVSINKIRIGSGILEEVPDIIWAFRGKKILLVADKNTYKVAGSRVEEILSGEFFVKKLVFQHDHLSADERTVGRLLMEMEDDIALIVTVGSGTLNDVSRFVSAKTGVPYVIVGTAPSMDGYASVVSPLICDGVKVTFSAVYPYAIIADIDVMKDAPMYMLQAGLGDVMGKYTGLADWRMAQILGREGTEYYCDTISHLVENAVVRCVDAAPGLAKRDKSAVEAVIEGLVLSGLAIGLAGHSRPASGSEHQIAHYWEMVFTQEGRKTHWVHGNKVGAATGMVLEAYHTLFSMDIEEIYKLGKYRRFDRKRWEAMVEDAFGKMAASIFALKEDHLVLEETKREGMMAGVRSKWDHLRKVCLGTILTPKKLNRVLEGVGAATHPKDLGVDRELFWKSFVAAKEIRNRYGILQLLEDLGLLEEFADIITDKYYGKTTC